MRWRVMRTFTPAVQAPVGLISVPYPRQHGTDGAANGLDRVALIEDEVGRAHTIEGDDEQPAECAYS